MEVATIASNYQSQVPDSFQMKLESLNCMGSEYSISQCHLGQWVHHDCGGSTFVAVDCTGLSSVLPTDPPTQEENYQTLGFRDDYSQYGESWL